MIFHTAEDAKRHVDQSSLEGDSFELKISDDFTFAGQPDVMGAGMAIVLDGILGQGFEPDGFDQHDGYRAYRYKPME